MTTGWEQWVGLLLPKRALTRRHERRALHCYVDEVEVLIEQLEDETRAEDNHVKFLRHERNIRRFAARRPQVHGDDEDTKEPDKLREQRHDEQHILVQMVDDEVPECGREK